MIHTSLSRRPARYHRLANRLRIDQLEQRVLLAADLNFVPLATSAVIAPTNSAIEAKPFTMPSTSYVQTIIERHVAPDNLPENSVAQNTLNESGPQPGRYLFTTSSTLTGSLIRTDLYTGETIDLLAVATADGQLDGETFAEHLSLQNLSAIRWTPWGTLLVAEAINGADAGYVEDPDFPNTIAADHGLVYEIVDPTGAAPVVFGRPALGSGVFEAIAIDANGQIYLDESVSGAILQFVSGATDDLSAPGTLSALLANAGDTGAANWTEIFAGIENLPFTLNSDPASFTSYADPQGMVIGATAQGPTLYVALRGDLSSRILAIDLDSDALNPGDQAVINVFADDTTTDAQTGLAAGTDFASRGSLALDSKGRLYVGEQQSLIAGDRGNDVWVAVDNDNDGVADKLGRRHSLATRGDVGTVGFGALVTGLYVNPFNDNELYANVSGSASQKDGIFLIESSALPNTGVFPIVVNGQTTLLVTGTNGSDNIIISGDNTVKVKINSMVYYGAPDLTIVVYGQRGNDRITVTGSVIF
ncbi:MAG TPA: LEPR-XLL domain-containing protein, partial [Pirellulaceae bacterium]|nr:LEPR-XLL domain-containing protein [Pirellulaceae bacterium]